MNKVAQELHSWMQYYIVDKIQHKGFSSRNKKTRVYGCVQYQQYIGDVLCKVYKQETMFFHMIQ